MFAAEQPAVVLHVWSLMKVSYPFPLCVALKVSPFLSSIVHVDVQAPMKTEETVIGL